jgi:hypothetical protein
MNERKFKEIAESLLKEDDDSNTDYLRGYFACLRDVLTYMEDNPNEEPVSEKIIQQK